MNEFSTLFKRYKNKVQTQKSSLNVIEAEKFIALIEEAYLNRGVVFVLENENGSPIFYKWLWQLSTFIKGPQPEWVFIQHVQPSEILTKGKKNDVVIIIQGVQDETIASKVMDSAQRLGMKTVFITANSKEKVDVRDHYAVLNVTYRELPFLKELYKQYFETVSTIVSITG